MSEMDVWISKFRTEREFDGIKEGTIKKDIDRLKVFLDYSFNRLNKAPDELRTADFVKYFNYLENERKNTRSTQNRYFNLLKVFYRLMRVPNFNDFADESRERKRFNGHEVQHYDPIYPDHLNEILLKIVESKSRTKFRDVVMIRLLWDTGCRVSEVLKLKYEDCDLSEGSFKLKNTKTKEERVVVCSKDTLYVLNNYLEYNIKKGSKDHVFQNLSGEMVGKAWISKIFRNAVNELKKDGKLPQNKKLVVHSLRHGRAVDLLDKGTPIDIVKEYLGHKSLETTLFYSHSQERKNKMLKNIQKIL
ncbi:tyrosine-type recombinase/integrase [Methanococcus maripaludis]|jgi:integrase/recombinase XerD|nr:phage integrase family protein [Methanococcus maripaludis X1]MDK2928627.1 integrase/recombinase XerD [Methanococcus sp.]BAP62925.1 putative site-specific recombinase [Methanococcus maripaludis OS7]